MIRRNKIDGEQITKHNSIDSHGGGGGGEVGRRRVDGRPADGALQVRRQPRIDAVDVEAVEAAGKKPPLLAVLELRQAHGAGDLLLHSRRVLEHRQPRQDGLRASGWWGIGCGGGLGHGGGGVERPGSGGRGDYSPITGRLWAVEGAFEAVIGDQKQHHGGEGADDDEDRAGVSISGHGSCRCDAMLNFMFLINRKVWSRRCFIVYGAVEK